MSKSIKPVIKWSGSKRSQAYEIVSKIPAYNRYFEPFLEGGEEAHSVDVEMAGAFCNLFFY